MKRVIIKASFFMDTDVFQHVSQWEKSLMDFYSAHSAELERMDILGAAGGELFYIVKKAEMIDPVAQPVKTQNLAKKLVEVRSKENPSLKKNTKPLVTVKEDSRPKRIFNAGKERAFKINKISMGNQKPQGT